MLSTPTTTITTKLLIMLAISCIAGVARVQAGYENYAAAQSVGATAYGSGGKVIGESHDFSDGDASSQHESLGSLADHLQRRHFPADYANDNEAGAVEYAEGEAEAAATELHEQSAVELDYGAHAQSNQIDLHGGYYGDFHSEPVVGIDHGKGAFSYSTLYEHKHEQAPEHKHLL